MYVSKSTIISFNFCDHLSYLKFSRLNISSHTHVAKNFCEDFEYISDGCIK